MRQLEGPIVGIAAAHDGDGYWLVSSRGDVYSFGDARFFGPSASLRPRIGVGPIVGIVATPGGRGYWLVSSGGGVFCFGDATYRGSAAGSGRVIVGMAPTPNGKGYWLAAQHGSVISFGDAPARGSVQGKSSLNQLVGIAGDHHGLGYWFLNSKGSTYGFGPAAATQARGLARSAVAIAADPAVVLPEPPVVASQGAPIKAASLEEIDAQGDMAVAFALSQVGKPYVYGGTGPFGYDCSGLALASWLAAGVHLPRTAAEQYYAGRHVPLSEVEPGDLVFWASDTADPSTIYHVAVLSRRGPHSPGDRDWSIGRGRLDVGARVGPPRNAALSALPLRRCSPKRCHCAAAPRATAPEPLPSRLPAALSRRGLSTSAGSPYFGVPRARNLRPFRPRKA